MRKRYSLSILRSRGDYTYTAIPRYFVNKSLQPLDPKLSASATIAVNHFKTKDLELGFTRGFTESQAFVRHFGLKALIRPSGTQLIYDTTQKSGTNAAGETFNSSRA